MSGRASRDKGCRFERQLVRDFQAAGRFAERVPLSGSAGGSFAGDVQVQVLSGRPWVFEAKKRGDGFKQLYSWIGAHDGLILGADREHPLVVLRMDKFLQLAESADKQRSVAE